MKRFAMIFVLVMLISQVILAQTFSIQGVLRDPLGKTVADGAYSLTFKIYNVNAGGTALWTETQGSVNILHGVYNVELGVVTSLANLPFDTQYWIGLSVAGGVELAPRFKMTKAPSALSVDGVKNVIPSAGNVGVGTHEPEAGLHIITNAANDDLLKIESSATGGNITVDKNGVMTVSVDSMQAADALVMDGHLSLVNGHAIKFSDGSALSSAYFGGSASSLTNNGTIIITADADKATEPGGSIDFLTGTDTHMSMMNNGLFKVGSGTVNYADGAGDLYVHDELEVDGTIYGASFSGNGASLTSLSASQLTTGTVPNARLDSDLQDLADGSLSGSKVGSGINAYNITAGTLSGSLVGSGISASNITTGTLSGALVGSGINASNITIGAIHNNLLNPIIERTSFIASDKIGIGTSSPSYSLDVHGDVRINPGTYYDILVTKESGGEPVIIPSYSRRGMLGTTDNYWYKVYTEYIYRSNEYSLSDSRVKQNIHSVSNSLDKVMKLRGVEYDINTSTHPFYKDRELKKGEKTTGNLGFIAQELMKIMPEMVVKDDETGYYMIRNYEQMFPVVVGAIQDLKAELDEKDVIINDLLKRVKALEKR